MLLYSGIRDFITPVLHTSFNFNDYSEAFRIIALTICIAIHIAIESIMVKDVYRNTDGSFIMRDIKHIMMFQPSVLVYVYINSPYIAIYYGNNPDVDVTKEATCCECVESMLLVLL